MKPSRSSRRALRRLRLADVRSVLLIRLRSIGDTVLLTPAIRNLKQACPHARLSVIVEAPSASVLDGNPDVDEIIVSPRKGGLSKTLKYAAKLLWSKFDLVLDFHGGPRANLAALLSTARFRVGWQSSRYSFVYNITVPEPMEVLKTDFLVHTVIGNLAFLSWIGVPWGSTETSLFVDPAGSSSVQARLAQAGIRDFDPIMIVHIGAIKPWKRYPAQRYARLLSSCLAQTRMRLVVLGAKEDIPTWNAICEHLTDEAKDALVPMVGKLPLSEVKALCQRAALYVGTDNGIMHIADALGTPCVALFAVTELRLWHPWQSLHIAVRPCADAFRDFSTCGYYGRPGGCIAQISEEQILSAIQDMEEMIAYCPNTISEGT